MSALKKPKVENESIEDEGRSHDEDKFEQEEALLALIEHRTKEVEHLGRRVAYYQSQLDESDRRLRDSESKLARLRCQNKSVPSKNLLADGTKDIKEVHGLSSPIHNNEGSSQKQFQSLPELLIPSPNPKKSEPKNSESDMRASVSSSVRTNTSVQPPSNSFVKLKEDKSCKKEAVEDQNKETKRKLEQKEHKELIPLICTCISPNTIKCHISSHISSQHKRKLRSLSLCPMNDSQLFVTRPSASLLSSTDCLSQKQRRWPEDIAWHPDGSRLFSVYVADGGDSQISVLNLNKTHGKGRVTFLQEKPHIKGIINSIVFPPWEETSFITGGSDHGVIYWNERDIEDSWKPKVLHRNLHSSAVMGVAGLHQKRTVLSVGADKKIYGFDLLAGRASFKHQLENKCMSVLPNPCDFNLFMVQTGSPETQLRLFDIRSRHSEVHEFGWKQESSESQSALINQSWSPNGLYLTSGSADPVIHIFDIRFKPQTPSQSIKAHQKRVFKAVWHSSHPLLISISSDLNIGLHNITQ